MAGEAVEMSIEEVEEHHRTFCSWSSQASNYSIFCVEHLPGKGGVAFDKGFEWNVFRLVQHLLAERVAVSGDVEWVEEKASLLTEPFKNLCSRSWAQNVDAGDVKPCFVYKIKDCCWRIERITVETVNETTVEAYSCCPDIFNCTGKFSCLVLVFFYGRFGFLFQCFLYQPGAPDILSG